MHMLRTAGVSMTEDQFFSWAESRDERCELIEGIVMMHAGATRNHEKIAKRIFASLYSQADDRLFDVNKGDFGVRVGQGFGKGSILYPDIVVDRQSAEGSERATITPIVIVEVLSESTDYAHHLDKLELYKQRDSLKQYVILEQGHPKAYVWLKAESGWPPEPSVHEGLDLTLAFPSLDAILFLANIYR